MASWLHNKEEVRAYGRIKRGELNDGQYFLHNWSCGRRIVYSWISGPAIGRTLAEGGTEK